MRRRGMAIAATHMRKARVAQAIANRSRARARIAAFGPKRAVAGGPRKRALGPRRRPGMRANAIVPRRAVGPRRRALGPRRRPAARLMMRPAAARVFGRGLR